MVNTINGDGTMSAVCDGCGCPMTLKEPAQGALHDWLVDMAHAVRCDDCLARAMEEERAQRVAERRERLAADLAARLEDMGIPSGMATIEKAPNPALGEWLWKMRTHSVVIGGASGVGKTTAVAAVLHCMAAKREVRARYCTLADLGTQWVAALRGERGGVDTFWWRLARLEVLAIDEMVGRGGFGKYSPATQELVSGIVDRVYSGAMRGVVWLLGNYHRGSWTESFDEPRALIRRLQEKFSCVWVEKDRVVGMEVR